MQRTREGHRGQLVIRKNTRFCPGRAPKSTERGHREPKQANGHPKRARNEGRVGPRTAKLEKTRENTPVLHYPLEKTIRTPGFAHWMQVTTQNTWLSDWSLDFALENMGFSLVSLVFFKLQICRPVACQGFVNKRRTHTCPPRRKRTHTRKNTQGLPDIINYVECVVRFASDKQCEDSAGLGDVLGFFIGHGSADPVTCCFSVQRFCLSVFPDSDGKLVTVTELLDDTSNNTNVYGDFGYSPPHQDMNRTDAPKRVVPSTPILSLTRFSALRVLPSGSGQEAKIHENTLFFLACFFRLRLWRPRRVHLSRPQKLR